MRRLVLLSGLLLLAACQNEAEEAVRKTLIDPEAGKFQDVQRCGGDSKIWSGEVNSKNRLGAYTGFEPFFYDGVVVSYASDANFSDLMAKCYSNLPNAVSSVSPGASSDSLGEPSSEPSDGSWSTSTDTNPVDDSKRIVSTLIADTGASSTGDPVSLVVRCNSNQTELFVNWGDYLGDDSGEVDGGWKDVTVRVGTRTAETQQWDISTDNESTFAPSPPVPLLKQMEVSSRLVLQTTPYDESPITAVFDLKGIGKALQPVAKECGWSQ